MDGGAFERDGHYLLKGLLPPGRIAELLDALAPLAGEINHYGVRNLMQRIPAIRTLATCPPLIDPVRSLLGDQAKPVRSVFFDKTPDANWNVPWHQDTSIALQAQVETPGFEHWSRKHGIIHAEPPEAYLRRMVTLRIHLDPADTASGVLRVISGTHRAGRIHADELLDIVARSPVVECNAQPGDVLMMSPLLFHASRKATAPTHRRIIHIEYSAMALPEPLAWHEAA